MSMHVEVCGPGRSGGRPVWLLHSLLADAGSCRPLAQAWSATHEVHLPELPGFGGSPMAADLAGVADRVAAAIGPAPVTVFGNGYGSFVALLVALRHPGCVTRLILAGTGAAFSEPGRQAFRGMAAAAAGKGLGAIADTAMRRLFAPAFQAANPGLMAERRAAFLATDPAVFGQACADLATLDLRADVGRIDVPTLVLVGDGDEATPPAMAEELAGLLPAAQFQLLPGLAHLPQLQDVKRFTAATHDFLEQGEVGRPGHNDKC